MAGKSPQQETGEDDDNDEDYVEPMDVNNDEDVLQETEEIQQKPLLSAQKRKAVDDAFEELFGYKYGTRFVLPRKKQMRSRKEIILVDMFGPTAAARLLSGATLVVDETASASPRRKYTLPPLQQQKKTVTKVKRFAGKDITVEVEENKPTKVTRLNKKKGLDHVLDQLQGPSKISTVAKTSADWDKFKTDKDLEDELEQKAKGKDAYLVKKDFLDRVDGRRFEHERSQRDKERASRQK